MEKSCTGSYYKKTLKEYRESTRKLYDTVDSLEDDRREKDEFARQIGERKK